MATIEGERDVVANGAALAAILGAGIGSFAMGFIVILNEAGVFSVPAIYAPAGGVTGRTTLAAVSWLIAWWVLHRRWNGRQIDSERIWAATLLLIALGVVLTFPPVWGLF